MDEKQLERIIKKIDAKRGDFVERLREAVAIPSVSGDPKRRDDVVKMVHYAAGLIKKLGGQVDLRELGKQKLHDGTELPLPPILLATLGNDRSKKTVCIYGHLDVQPAAKIDGWDTEPFTLTEKNGALFGRGATDDKGPVMGWLNCIEAFREEGIELPLNIKFCLEGMEESGSEGLDDFVFAEKDRFFSDVDFICISDSYWLGTEKPCLGY